MVSLFTKLLPYLLLFYFLARSVKNPIHLLGIPFLMFFGYSIFFENVKIFAVPGRFSFDIRFTSWLIIFWIVLRGIFASQSSSKSNNFSNKSERNSLDYIVIGLMIISIVDLFMVYLEFLRI